MVEWIFERLGLVIFVVIFLSQIVRGILRARKAKQEHETGYDETAEGRRVREIQERIRRQVAERRGQPMAEPPPLAREYGEPPVARPETTQLPEVFGGPLGRMLEDLQKRAQPESSAPPPPIYAHVSNTAEVQRQETLAEELRVLEEQRVLVQRRAAYIAAAKTAETNSSSGVRSAARVRTLLDLRDPEALRRAFVLREVLGPPVGLR